MPIFLFLKKEIESIEQEQEMFAGEDDWSESFMGSKIWEV
jgi:hypothetical protein